MENYLFFGLILIAVGALVVHAVTSRTRSISGQATVTSHRVAHRSELPREDAQWLGAWNYLVTFTLSDGEEIELYATEADYADLEEGVSGYLTWQGKRFLDFQTN